jgi:hypothetical protein
MRAEVTGWKIIGQTVVKATTWGNHRKNLGEFPVMTSLPSKTDARYPLKMSLTHTALKSLVPLAEFKV